MFSVNRPGPSAETGGFWGSFFLLICKSGMKYSEIKKICGVQVWKIFFWREEGGQKNYKYIAVIKSTVS
jgi:hypothetical protein